MYPKKIGFLSISLAPSHDQPEIFKKTWEKSTKISPSVYHSAEYLLRYLGKSPCFVTEGGRAGGGRPRDPQLGRSHALGLRNGTGCGKSLIAMLFTSRDA